MKIITSKLSRRVVVSNDTYREVQRYDKDNLYPQNISMIIGGSGTATSDADLFARFIIGRGFEKNGDKVVNNNGDTLNKILRLCARDYSKYYGFALHFNYNANLKIASIKHVPFEHTRLGLPDDYGYVSKIAVNDDWALWYRKRFLKADIDFIDIFDPDPEVVLSQVLNAGSFRKYKGQILWFSFEGRFTYPKSPFDPILEDVETDSRIKTSKYKNIITSFSAGHLFKHYGEFETQAERDDFVKELNTFQGDENSGSVMLVELAEDEKPPEIEAFENVNKDKLYEYTEGSIQSNIRKQLRIPPVLAGDLIAGRLGTAEEILDANILYNAYTEDDRKEFEETFSKVMKVFRSPIKSDLKITPLTIMTEEILAKRTQKETKDKTEDDNKTDNNK